MSFQCVPNCSNCCGVVPIPREIYEKHKEKITKEIQDFHIMSSGEVFIVPTDLKCVFLHENRCLIYEDRPNICKFFGKKELPCPYIKPNGQKRSDAGKKKILKEIKEGVFQCYQIKQ